MLWKLDGGVKKYLIKNIRVSSSSCEAPDRAGGVLDPAEDVVQGEVVPDRVLPAVGVVAVEGERGGEPGVDLVQVHLLPRRLGQRLVVEANEIFFMASIEKIFADVRTCLMSAA